MHEKTALPKEVEIKLRNFWDNYLQNVKLFSPNGHTFVLVIYDEDVNEQLGKLASEQLEVEYKLFGVDYRVISLAVYLYNRTRRFDASIFYDYAT